MSQDVVPTTIYVGAREAIIAEVGTDPVYSGAFLIQPEAADGTSFCAEGEDTPEGVKRLVAWYRENFPGIKVKYID